MCDQGLSPSNYQSQKNQELSPENVSCVAAIEMMVRREEEEGGRRRRSSGALIFPKQTSFKLVITRRCSFSAETPDFMERKHKML